MAAWFNLGQSIGPRPQSKITQVPSTACILHFQRAWEQWSWVSLPASVPSPASLLPIFSSYCAIWFYSNCYSPWLQSRAFFWPRFPLEQSSFYGFSNLPVFEVNTQREISKWNSKKPWKSHQCSGLCSFLWQEQTGAWSSPCFVRSWLIHSHVALGSSLSSLVQWNILLP